MGLARAGSSACVSRNEAPTKHSEAIPPDWSEQLKSGRAILRGAVNDYWGNTAVMVFEAASCEEAETICRRDAHRALGRPSGTLLLPENLV